MNIKSKITLQKIDSYIPRPVIALIIGSLLASFYFTNQTIIGHIPSGIPSFSIYVPTLTELPEIIFYAAMLASLGVIDSLLTSVVADNMANTNHLPRKESIGQGIGNIFSAQGNYLCIYSHLRSSRKHFC